MTNFQTYCKDFRSRSSKPQRMTKKWVFWTS